MTTWVPAVEPEELPGWWPLALCAETDPEVFFPEKGGNNAPAKRVCGRCEVRAECLEYALSWPGLPLDGIWGGTSFTQRRDLLRDRRNGRAA